MARVAGFTETATVQMPLLVAIDDFSGTQHYYFWFFGYVAKLPYEREIDPVTNIDDSLEP